MKKFLAFLLLVLQGNFFSQTDSSSAIQPIKDSSNLSNVPLYNVSGDELESDVDEQQISSLLQSSRDVFTQFSTFQFTQGNYRARGYAADQQSILLNGIKLENPENGFSSFSGLSGLNDVIRNIEHGLGNGANRLAFSGAGGFVNIDARASSFRGGTKFSYSHSNRFFSNGAAITHATGMIKNGWAMTFSASFREGNAVYRPGTFVKASAFYFSLEKQVHPRWFISLIAFGNPTQKAGFSSALRETFQLTDNNYYNNLWGYQNGQVRNSAVNTTKKSTVILSQHYTTSSKTKINCAVFFSAGNSSLSGLNWNNTLDPRPDYYSYLPSYFYNKGNTVQAETITRQWQNDMNTQQINWDKMIQTNLGNLYTLPQQNGQTINTDETRARYIVENRIEQQRQYGFNTIFNKRFAGVFLSAGIIATVYNNRKYKKMSDLLGASYWLDYDIFAQNLGVDPTFKQNNIEAPDKKIYKNDRFGYDYSVNIQSLENWCQLETNLKRFDIYAGICASAETIWREGFMANGKFPESSKGQSEKIKFINYGLKAGVTYKLTGRHFISLNGLNQTNSPAVKNIFISGTTRNKFVEQLRPGKITSLDFNYFLKFPTLKARFTAYYTVAANQLWHRVYYSELYSTNINVIMKNIKQLNQGIEIGLEKTAFKVHLLQCAIGLGQFVYLNRPNLQAWQDNDGKALYDSRTVYLKNYRVGSTPQTVLGLGYKYNSKKWFGGITFNYFDQIFVEVNPDRRTEEALLSFFENEIQLINKIIHQEQLPAYYILNASAGKSFRFYKKYFLQLNLSVNNLLNNKSNLLNGREQMRWDAANLEKFSNKYTYMTGLTYMSTASLTF